MNNTNGDSWRWIEAAVDETSEHMRICYGDDRLPVALVAPPWGTTFVVQFILDSADDLGADALAAVRRELDFYLVEKPEPRPWEYAIYHCSIMSNVYSDVHWEYFPDGAKQ